MRFDILDSFDEISFNKLITCLETKGYVTDAKDEDSISFSSVQIENLDQESFSTLCAKFNINSKINIFVIGDFDDSFGASYLVYNTNILEYEDAKKILKHYFIQNRDLT